MLQFEVEREFPHSADTVWAITGDFGGLKNWLPGIVGSRVEGSGAANAGGNAVRIIDVFDGSVTRESLETLDAAYYTYQYRILEAKGFDASSNYLATFRITPLGPERCRINWGATFRLPDGIPAEKGDRAKQKVAQMYAMCLQHLDGVLAAR